MARYATYLRASTNDQETTHQHDAIDEWLAEHDVDHSAVDRFIDLAQSGADPGREQFTELVKAIGAGEYEYVIVWEISRLARLGSIYQRFFEECEDAGTTVAVTDGWVEEVRPDGTGKLIADISAAVAEEERRRLTKRIKSGVSRAQREGKWLYAAIDTDSKHTLGGRRVQPPLDRPRDGLDTTTTTTDRIERSMNEH